MTDGQGASGGYPAPVGTVPVLARVPAGEMIHSTRHEPKLRVAEVLHSDMSWRRVSVLAWAGHRNGWAVLIRWPDGREDWRAYDRRHIRPALSLRSRLRAGASKLLGIPCHEEAPDVVVTEPVRAFQPRAAGSALLD
jgi:hypothetical protein